MRMTPVSVAIRIMTDADMAMIGKIPLISRFQRTFLIKPEVLDEVFAKTWFKLTHQDLDQSRVIVYARTFTWVRSDSSRQ
jgi:catalase (peroxidase I)